MEQEGNCSARKRFADRLLTVTAGPADSETKGAGAGRPEKSPPAALSGAHRFYCNRASCYAAGNEKSRIEG